MRYFKHNDVADLERVLLEVAAEDRRVRCASGLMPMLYRFNEVL